MTGCVLMASVAVSIGGQNDERQPALPPGKAADATRWRDARQRGNGVKNPGFAGHGHGNQFRLD
jgi:hypothetical protein